MQIHLFFHGEVQQVGFRAAAKRIATEMGIYGFTRNCNDESVEVVAQAPLEKIELFISRLQKMFQVTQIQRQEETIGFVFSDFAIL